MKFLIQKIDKEIRHDFSFTLLESIRFINWLRENNKKDKLYIKYFNTVSEQKEFKFKVSHKNYTPIGSVEFVSAHLYQFFNKIPKPLNVPKELINFSNRKIWNGNHMDIEDLDHQIFAKSNDEIKKFTNIIDSIIDLPIGNYQFSELIKIDSEWRVFVYDNKLVGLQNYSGDFTIFPDVLTVNLMINQYKPIAPIAYTLDVGINTDIDGEDENNTFVIECHEFFSCGLYGFAEHNILPYMFNKAYKEIINN